MKHMNRKQNMNNCKSEMTLVQIASCLLLVFTSAVSVLAQSYAERMDNARSMRLSGHVEEAMEIYSVILNDNPRDVDALVGRAYCLLRDSEKLDAALSDFQKVVVLTPRYVDAYIGCAIVLRRNGDWEGAEQILLKCEKECSDDVKKLRYLAESAWREGQFVIARRLDTQYGLEKNRSLLPYPSRVSVGSSRAWLEWGDDWHSEDVGVSHRPRPDISLQAGYEHCRRYGQDDWIADIGAGYRHSYRTSLSWAGAFSDNSGFLAKQKHRFSIDRKILKRTSIEAGAGFSNYGEHWSRRGIFQTEQRAGNFYGRYRLDAGKDTHDETVATHTFAVGYDKELRYSLMLSYSDGEETVEIARNDNFEFRNDTVDTFYARLGFYFRETEGFYLGLLRESRNGQLFRRGINVSLFKRF